MISHLYLDIETIPAQRPDVLDEIRATEQKALDDAIASVKPPSNYGAEAAAKWMAEKGQKQIDDLTTAYQATVDEAYRKTGLDGAFGQIAVVSFAHNDGEPVKLWSANWNRPASEVVVLTCLNEALHDSIPANAMFTLQVIGHNVSAFDLRFLVQRSIVNGVRPHQALARAAQAKPWETEKVFDTMVQWAGVGRTISLDKLCRALGLPAKGDIDGSKVWDYVKAGRIAEVADYCADDVRKVRAVHQRMTFSTLAQPQFEDVQA